MKKGASPVTICVDMGTTNTRVWLVENGTILERVTEMVGVRDVARLGKIGLVAETLRTKIGAVATLSKKLNRQPVGVLGAGMLTSKLGLREIPHIPSPAGEAELAKGMQHLAMPEVFDHPIHLVPGVRTGPANPSLDDIASVDLIRGEETVVAGLLQSGILRANSTLLNLGSHWKAISVNAQGQIVASHTTLSGELIQALQEQTVLASALPKGRFEGLDLDWLGKGRKYFVQEGMGRSLFSVRLLEQLFQMSPVALSSFLLGAVIESDVSGMRKAGHLQNQVVITGSGAAARAWLEVLQGSGKSCAICPAEAVESAFVSGLERIFHLSNGHRATK
jgi:2-dehydro-3-deoxygalactonokinase